MFVDVFSQYLSLEDFQLFCYYLRNREPENWRSVAQHWTNGDFVKRTDLSQLLKFVNLSKFNHKFFMVSLMEIPVLSRNNSRRLFCDTAFLAHFPDACLNCRFGHFSVDSPRFVVHTYEDKSHPQILTLSTN
uniref:Uncharacterized protein n=1 Tax=Glossina austeni TaxID=7395 RepID=A0A1A9V139_GLOAU